MMTTGAVWRVVVPANLTVPQINHDTVWQVKLIRHEPAEAMPQRNDEKSTTTKSGLYFQRLREGKGSRPEAGSMCILSWAFWRPDGAFIAGTKLQGPMQLLLGRAPHKFLEEVVPKMQVGEILRVEVPSKQTPPRMIPHKTVWRLELKVIKPKLPLPKFVLPDAKELTTTKSGLQYKVLAKGPADGKTPKPGSTVTVHYAGWLKDGTLFDASYERHQPQPIQLGRVIPGWTEALQLMRPGDQYLLVIPSKLAYGPRGAGNRIPPDATLVFRVHFLHHGAEPPAKAGDKK